MKPNSNARACARYIRKYKKERNNGDDKVYEWIFSTIRMCVRVCVTLKKYKKERKKGDNKVCSVKNGKSSLKPPIHFKITKTP